MISRLSRYLAAGLVLFAGFALSGCSGGNAGGETAAPPVQLVAQSFNEGCPLCHRTGSIADVSAVHSLAANSPKPTITGVTAA
ncbi:MAG: hypothetical protein Q8P24_15725, partial [Desulfobacterales bacterium]|nr:hypothetical protein [Desulfobacterales bacterium]